MKRKMLWEIWRGWDRKQFLLFLVAMIVFAASQHADRCYLNWAVAAAFWFLFELMFGELVNVRNIPEAFYYVPKTSEIFHPYLSFRILAESALYFLSTVLVLAVVCGAQKLGGAQYFVGNPAWQGVCAALLFFWLLRWRAQTVAKAVWGTDAPRVTGWRRIARFGTALLHFMCIQYAQLPIVRYVDQKGPAHAPLTIVDGFVLAVAALCIACAAYDAYAAIASDLRHS